MKDITLCSQFIANNQFTILIVFKFIFYFFVFCYLYSFLYSFCCSFRHILTYSHH